MKREYEEFKVWINTLVAKAQKVLEEGWTMQDGTLWSGNNVRDHPGMIQVFLGQSGALDTDGNQLPRLVYVSREKKSGQNHHEKAGAMNALKGSQGGNVFYDGSIAGRKVCYVQFPQRLDGIDRYANRNTAFFDAFYGFDAPKTKKPYLLRTCNCLPKWVYCGCYCSGKKKKATKAKSDKKKRNSKIVEDRTPVLALEGAEKSFEGRKPTVGAKPAPSQGLGQGRRAPRERIGISGELESMITDYQQSKGSSNLVRASSSNVMLMGSLGRLLEAVFECREPIKIDPYYHRAHHRLANLNLRLGETKKALYHYKHSGSEADTTDIAKAKVLQTHLLKCTEARRHRDWNTLIKETEVTISSSADSAPQIFTLQVEAFLKLHKHQDADTTLLNGPNFNFDDCTKFFGPIGNVNLLLIRAQVDMVTGSGGRSTGQSSRFEQQGAITAVPILNLSRASSIIMLRAYAAYLFFQLKTHRQLFETEDLEDESDDSVMEEDADASETWGLSVSFIGIILLLIVGNITEHTGAVIFSFKNKLDISLGVALGSATRISVFVMNPVQNVMYPNPERSLHAQY
ncbi:hypothetical protein GIB67_015777 [Kingdonia uniflora]|uniref:Uncharacterized protein n=1 Tax=Kingdonia uniflora TaxID=39325 RepID=A0A7J7NUE0_9MAGN|nr:hypothetical protein GIB67_015777 [Kingdonia uniflora]